MARINQKKLEDYASKLYRGILRRYKEESEEEDILWNSFFKRAVTVERKNPGISMQKDVAEACKWKCVICREKYLDKSNFQFHHINGDSSYAVQRNLVWVCHRDHAKIHTKAKARLQAYKVRVGRKESPGIFPSLDVDIPEIDIPEPPDLGFWESLSRYVG